MLSTASFRARVAALTSGDRKAYIAQAAQALATLFALALFLTALGPKWTLTLGAASWALLYLIYVIGKPKWLLVSGQVSGQASGWSTSWRHSPSWPWYRSSDAIMRR